jgi:hypothetical protein
MRRIWGVVLVAAGSCIATTAFAQAGTAAERMSQPSPERLALGRDIGAWDVVATLWPSANTTPVVTRGLVAERTMVGSILQEVMRPASASGVPDFRRIDYLDFDRVEGRWKYVSMDTRFPVSIMPASSLGPARGDTITLQFAPQAFVGFGTAVEGRFMVCDLVITHADADHETKRQHCNMATGGGAPWRFVEYTYTRRR